MVRAALVAMDRLTLPRDVCEAIGAQEGDEIEFTLTEGALTLRRREWDEGPTTADLNGAWPVRPGDRPHWYRSDEVFLAAMIADRTGTELPDPTRASALDEQRVEVLRPAV